MTAKKQARQKIYLGWRIHGRLVARIALLMGVYQLVLWEASCAHQYLGYLSALRDVKTRIPVLSYFGNYLRDNVGMVTFGGLFALVILWEVVRLTHRVVGPLKRMESLLYAMAEGDYVRDVKFRKGDLVEGLEKALNAYLSSPDVCAARKARAMAGQEETTADEKELAKLPTTASLDATPAALTEEHLTELLEDLQPIDQHAGMTSV